jgi:hypothetical protein
MNIMAKLKLYLLAKSKQLKYASLSQWQLMHPSPCDLHKPTYPSPTTLGIKCKHILS